MAGLCGPTVLVLLAAGLIGLGQTNPPDNSTVVDEGNSTGQGNTTVVDEGNSTVSPQGTPSSHQTSLTSPSSTSASPPSISASPSRTSTSPSSTPGSPSSTPTSPSSTPGSPSSTPTSPSSTPGSPSSTPTSPSSTPGSPSSTPTSPSSTPGSPSSTPTSPSSTFASPANTSNATTSATTSHPTSPCYNFQASESGFVLTLSNFTGENYDLTLTDQKTNDSREEKVTLNVTNQIHHVRYLKPSTTYSAQIPLQACEENVNWTTKGINTTDFEEHDSNKSICYTTDWNITSFVDTSSKTGKRFEFCIRPKNNDLCSEFPTVPQLNFTKWVGSEFLNTMDVHLTVQERLPPQINWTNNPCKLTIDFTCRDTDRSSGNSASNKTFFLNELKPYTYYRCDGIIKNKTRPFRPVDNKVTKNVYIKCDVTLTVTPTPLSKSIKLDWTTTSENCLNINQDLQYKCSCKRKEHTDRKTETVHTLKNATSCQIDNLPYFKYDCTVEANHQTTFITMAYSKNVQPGPGEPDVVSSLVGTIKTANSFHITCHPLSDEAWYGPEHKYIATLNPGNVIHKNEKCDFKFNDLSYSTSYNVTVLAANTKFKGPATSILIATRYNDKALIGFLVFLIVLTCVALAFVLQRIYILHRKKSHRDGSVMLLPTSNEEDQLMRVQPITAEVLLDVYKKKIADEGRLFLAEFQSIPRIFSRNTMKEAKKSHNAIKNRYVDILPYDCNRVQLTSGNGETGCDYINASFINGFQEPKKYIAAQGPKDETVAAFWRMVWEQNSSIIVMVTRCEESNRVKCAQYWPSPTRDKDTYEEFGVQLHKEEHCPDYIIRRLTLSNKKEQVEREVTQIQFISWPDHGVPEDPQLLLKLRKRVNTFKNLFSGPIVIHCSAGVGRTGTYISIDAMMESLEALGHMDIYGYIVNLRKQRCLMVQVETQYILIHQAMIEHNEFGETEISLPEFHSTLSMLSETGSGTETSLLQEEFKRLPMYSNRRTRNTGLTEENKKKNRVSSVIPYDYNRVFVKLEEDDIDNQSHEYGDEEETPSSDEEDEETLKYINASDIDGYWGQGRLITAQSPLANTIADFWLMVYQKRASAIVMLSDGSEDSTDCSPYWAQDKKAFEDIEVEVTETECTPAFTSRTMLIYHTKRKESRRVKQFQFLQWPCQQLPEDSSQLTDMIRKVKQTCGYSKGSPGDRGPLVVHCRDGSSQCGVFCALWNMMDSAHTERMVDVFQVAKSLRKQRQGMISSQEQYQFLYEAMAAAFPVQNGEVTVVDEHALIDETAQTQEPAGDAADDQQEAVAANAAESTTLLIDLLATEEQNEAAPKTTMSEAATNGPTVTMEV